MRIRAGTSRGVLRGPTNPVPPRRPPILLSAPLPALSDPVVPELSGLEIEIHAGALGSHLCDEVVVWRPFVGEGRRLRRCALARPLYYSVRSSGRVGSGRVGVTVTPCELRGNFVRSSLIVRSVFARTLFSFTRPLHTLFRLLTALQNRRPRLLIIVPIVKLEPAPLLLPQPARHEFVRGVT